MSEPSAKRRHHQSGPEWPGGINPAVPLDDLRAEAAAARAFADHLDEVAEAREKEARDGNRRD